MAGTRVLMTVDGYSKILEALNAGGGSIKSERFRVGGHSWYIEYRPFDFDEDEEEDGDWVGAYLCLDRPGANDEVKVRHELALLDPAPVAQPVLNGGLGPALKVDSQQCLARQVGLDVTFHVGGEMFTAHRCVLADDMEPRVFRALLHFIYTDTLPEVKEGDDDKVAVAQGLLVAADRYGVERLKSTCSEMLCTCIDARTAMTLLQLADSHCCRRLKQACIRVIKDMLAKVATP
ncbi:hypothetical protein SETIT_8G198700v2 [Setaria italica]|uniref:BTB domain-containing protein n=1 Tax=Setaria italica TaxID=4555 RepID=A0A368S9V0_SETIT|nr:hypothetical protein SETIT_8G198700v2 [Setaria italica]